MFAGVSCKWPINFKFRYFVYITCLLYILPISTKNMATECFNIQFIYYLSAYFVW